VNRKMLIGAFVGVLAVTASAPVFAHSESERTTSDDNSTISERLSSTTKSVVRKTEDTVHDATNLTETVKSQREQVEGQKMTLREELSHMRAEAKEKLAGRRLAQCQNRQTQINTLLDKSVANGRERLTRIQKFENGVREFYQKKKLSSEQFTDVSSTVDAKEAAAIAALDVMDAETFDCTTIDGAKPSNTIKVTHEAKRKALDEYRDSVREMIKVVKEAFAASQPGTEEGEQQ
jgi:gas vesicle protein